MQEILKNRFNENMDRHPNLEWEVVESRLKDNPAALKALRNMEESGGEPDTIGFDEAGNRLIFCDCSAKRHHPAPAKRQRMVTMSEGFRSI